MPNPVLCHISPFMELLNMNQQHPMPPETNPGGYDFRHPGPDLDAGCALNKRRHVVIIGGGFGGLSAARALKSTPVDVTLIDRRNFHLFQPLLYQVATGSLSPGEIAAPLRSVLSKQKNTQVLMGEVGDIDPRGKKILLKDGAQVEYDSLIVATGSQSVYFGHDEWKKWSPP